MKLKKVTNFRNEYFDDDSRPDVRTLRKLIDAGELPGSVIGKNYFVDIDKLELSSCFISLDSDVAEAVSLD